MRLNHTVKKCFLLNNIIFDYIHQGQEVVMHNYGRKELSIRKDGQQCLELGLTWIFSDPFDSLKKKWFYSSYNCRIKVRVPVKIYLYVIIYLNFYQHVHNRYFILIKPLDEFIFSKNIALIILYCITILLILFTSWLVCSIPNEYNY